MLKRAKTARSHLRRSMPIFRNPTKVWHNPVKRGEILNTSIKYLKKIIRLLYNIDKSAEESTNDHERYELHSFIASTLKDRTIEIFKENHIHMPVENINSPDPFDYIKDLIAYIKEILEKTNNSEGPQLMPVSPRKLADALEEMEKRVNEDIEERQRIISHTDKNNSVNEVNNSGDDLLKLFKSLKL
jgi:hypothetical protein